MTRALGVVPPRRPNQELPGAFWPLAVGQQVVLEHNKECNASSRQAAREQCVSTETLERECSGDVRQWTIAGLRKTDMFRLLNARYSPLSLGEEGRRKVGGDRGQPGGARYGSSSPHDPGVLGEAVRGIYLCFELVQALG